MPTPPEVETRQSRLSRAESALRRRRIEAILTTIILVACVGFVFLQLQPRLIFTNNTPAGGDMAAHVWAPAYLRDHLLPHFRLTGWTPDWYAGFPALRFYMVPPMLAIVVLDWIFAYGVAFKLVAISGLLALPLAAYAFGRLANLKFPTPALLAVSTLPYLFSRSYSIYGGNIPSTLAGEFAFSISLALAVVYLGLVINGLRTGNYRALAAVTVGLCALTHVIPLIFAIVGTFVALAIWPSKRGLKWLATTTPVGALLAAWWLLPFWGQRAFLNDMGWTKLVPPATAGTAEQIGFWLTGMFPVDARWAANLALVGLVVALFRRERTGFYLATLIVVGGLGYVLVPQGRLWNARLLPFIHLLTFMLAFYTVGQILRWIGENQETVAHGIRKAGAGGADWIRAGGAIVALLATLILVALPLRVLPFFGKTSDDGTYSWLFLSTRDSSYIPGWARWNFTGYEGKAEWVEYDNLVQTMAGVGAEYGCGRAMWEYDREALDRFGSPMALMLLPFWTDGCIGSMEGLYFESSTTTPFHFLNQSALSAKPSRAQRDMPYGDFDINLGIAQLQKLGVSYYMAQSDVAIAAANGHPDLREIARSNNWIIYQVAHSELVEPLQYQPVVLSDVHDASHEWLPVVAPWFQDRGRWDVLLASSGPERWQRVAGVDEAGNPLDHIDTELVPLPEVEVTNIASGDDWLSFDVSEPGVPVLVKTSYFPNWEARGADGPWRVSPSFMVVTPTSTHVELHYGRSGVETAGWALTIAGLVGLAVLVRRGPIAPVDRTVASHYVAGNAARAPRLSVVVPAYREATHIGQTIARLRQELPQYTQDQGSLEIVVVDDGSGDDTAEQARLAGADQVISFAANQGKGAAVRAGMVAAKGQVVAFTDADLAYSPTQVGLLASGVEAGTAAVVVGDRHVEGSVAEVEAVALRRFGNKVVNRIVRLVVGFQGDTQCGVKAFSHEAAQAIFGQSRIDGFGFDIEVFVLAQRYGYSVQAHPVRVINSTSSTVKVVRDGLQLVFDLLRVAFWRTTGGYPLPGEVRAQLQATMPRPTSVDSMSELDTIVKAYDIRGIVPDQLNAEVAEALGVGFAKFISESEFARDRIIVARDMRPSGPELVEAFTQGVLSQGLDVVDIGLASTDMLYFASGYLDAPGAMFTASHNPAEYNGIKLAQAGARPVGESTGLADIKAYVLNPPSPATRRGQLTSQDLLSEFVAHVHSFVDVSALKPLKVVADTANGMGGLVVPAAFAGLPIDLEVMYPELDGTFPNHPANPIEVENLADLRRRVIETGADLGLAFDGDADRVFLVDEHGEPISGSLTTALIAIGVLERDPGAKIIYNLICSAAVPEVIAEHGGQAIRSRVGHSFIKQVMAETGAAFGGEHSAHYYFRDNWRADSGLIAAFVVLEALSKSGGTLSQLIAPLDRYAASGEINTQVASPQAVIEHVASVYSQWPQDRLDGLTVTGDGWWFNLRPSNTEPLLRLNLEAQTRAECDRMVAEVKSHFAAV